MSEGTIQISQPDVKYFLVYLFIWIDRCYAAYNQEAIAKNRKTYYIMIW